MPTQTINLNNTIPVAPADALNIQWQADPASLDPTVARNVSAYFSAFTGDTGAGGKMGLVPAPPAGAAAAGKVLMADGTWYVPPTPALPSGAANLVIATPNGSSGLSTPRALVPADLPVATTTALGAVQPDGATIDVAAGVISVPTATASALGLVKPDGSTVKILAGVLSAVGSSMSNPMTAEGDIIVGGASGAAIRLGAGTAGQVLQTNGAYAAPGWVTPVGEDPLTTPVVLPAATPDTVCLVVKGSSAPFTPSFLQGAHGWGNSVPFSVAFPNNISAGSAIIATVSGQYGWPTGSSLTDTLGNTYALVDSGVGGNGWSMAVFVASNSPAGRNSLSFNSTGEYLIVAISEYANVARVSPVQAEARTQSGTTSSLAVGPVTAANLNLVFTAVLHDGTASTSGAPVFTARVSATSPFGLLVDTADSIAYATSIGATWAMIGESWAAAVILVLENFSSGSQLVDLVDYESPQGLILSAVNAQGQFVLPTTSGAPSNTPVACAMAFDPAANKLWIFNGTAWVGTVLS